jgi:hypothetical protein
LFQRGHSCSAFGTSYSQWRFFLELERYALRDIEELRNEFTKITEELKKVPATPEELAALKKYLEVVYESVRGRNRKMSSANERFAFLEEYHFEVTNEEFQYRHQTLQMPQRISVLMEETDRGLAVERIRLLPSVTSSLPSVPSLPTWI